MSTPHHHPENSPRNLLQNSTPPLRSRRFLMRSQITTPLSHLVIHDTFWRPPMEVMMMRKILPPMETKRMRHLKKVMKPNWVCSLIIASYTELTISIIEQLSKEWTSSIYVFFRMSPHIDYVDSRCAHIFECAAGRCQSKNGRDIC